MEDGTMRMRFLALTLMMLAVASMSVSAYYSGFGLNYASRYNPNFGYGYNSYGYNYLDSGYFSTLPRSNPYYGQYVSGHSFLRDTTYKQAIKRFHYQEHSSPYLVVSSPYGKKPWIKPYGDGFPRTLTPQAYNPFFGFQYQRGYNCHSPSACHYHNIFPNS